MAEAFGRQNCFLRSFAGISQSHIDRGEFLLTEASSFAQRIADNASADICCARIVLRELLAREITGGAVEVSINELVEVVSDQSSLRKFFRCSRNLLRYLRESLQQGTRRIQGNWSRSIFWQSHSFVNNFPVSLRSAFAAKRLRDGKSRCQAVKFCGFRDRLG